MSQENSNSSGKKQTSELGSRFSLSSNGLVGGLLGLTTLGLVLSASLTFHYYDLRNGTGSLQTFCNINSTINCDAVATSRYAELLPGIPLSSFSAGWYVAMLVLTLVLWSRNNRTTLARILFAMSAIGSAFSIVYFFIMSSVLKTYCLQCLGIDAVNFALTGLLWMAKPFRAPTASRSRDAEPDFAFTTAAGITAVALALSVLFLKTFDSARSMGVSYDELAQSVLNTSPNPPALASFDAYPFLGAADAKITILEFSDFQCPHCHSGAQIMHALLQRYPGQVKVVFRGFPLDASCNRFMKGRLHDAACEAAKMALCAQKQGKFQQVYAAFFDNQEKLAPGKLEALATSAGADSEQLRACMSSPEVDQLLARSIEDANQWGVESTPTFFVNGKKVQGALPLPVWSKIVDQLAQAR